MPTTTTPAIERRLDLAADVDRVWRALTTSSEVATWFSEQAEVPTELGGEGFLAWREHGRFAIRTEAYDPPRHLAIRWARDPDTALAGGPSTLVEWWLEPGSHGGTHLRLRETGFVRDEDRSSNVHGWIGAFRGLLEHVTDQPWQRGIRKTYALRSSPERVWRAFTDPEEFRTWFGGQEPVSMEAGTDGWFVWPAHGRFAIRVDHVEPTEYLAWRWVTTPDLPIDEAAEVLRTEWMLQPRADGGTDLHLFETGFAGPDGHRDNDGGWDGDVIPSLRRTLGEGD